MRLKLYINEGINDKGIFKAVFMAGHPGSGKSYTLSKIKSGSVEPRVVNTDRAYPLYKKYWNTDWGRIADDVKRISTNSLALYLNSMLPLAIDGTSNLPSVVLRRRGIIESFGYDTAMVFVNTSLETAIERAREREKKMGRAVDEDFIKKVYDDLSKAKSFYKSRFSGNWAEVDNDIGELTDKVIVKAFKFMSAFYNSPVVNPIGKGHMDMMRENGWKYLDPHVVPMNRIKKSLSGWY